MLSILKGDLKDVPTSWTKMGFWRPWAKDWLTEGVIKYYPMDLLQMGTVKVFGWESGS
jgi:hypothetical protein